MPISMQHWWNDTDRRKSQVIRKEPAQVPLFHYYYYYYYYSGIRIFNSLPRSITNLKNEKTQFKVALNKFLNAHSFYSVDELFTCTDDMYCWLYDCVNVSYTVMFLLFVCLWHVPHPIVLWLSRIYVMYVCMYVCTTQASAVKGQWLTLSDTAF